MDKETLITELVLLKKDSDLEASHNEADQLLIEFINDKDIENAYNDLDKWYA